MWLAIVTVPAFTAAVSHKFHATQTAPQAAMAAR